MPLHLSTHLTGPPTGDTGVYVWNTWVFRHEMVEQGQSPFRTHSIFRVGTEADLSLHNYTVFADLIAVPLQPVLGVVATFNAVYLINVALAGFGMFLLARRVTGRAVESWIAGAVFACSPFMVARSTAHFSLIAAAPLPIFVYWFDRAWETQQSRYAAAAGATMAWAAYCDPYYAVYCVVLAGALAAARILTWSPGIERVRAPRIARLALDAIIVALGVTIAAVTLTGTGQVRLGSLTLSMRTLYTPVLLLTLLVLWRLVLSFRVRLTWRFSSLEQLVRPALISAVVAALLLSPMLVALGRRAVEGRLAGAPVLWRSSPPGVDLAAFITPNPTHPLTPAAVVDWTTNGPGGFAEQVAALPLVGLLILVLAWRHARYRPDRFWLTTTVLFGLMALGPFIHVAGFNTFVPTPWAFLRYLPVLGSARMPARFTIVVMIGFCVLLAGALAALTARDDRRRRWILTAAMLALGVELLPIPRTLYSAEIPAIYDIVAADPRPIGVLELPYGVRDGLSSLGNFNAVVQFYQTAHGKPIAGGYLSRVSARRKALYQKFPVRRALMQLSEGGTLSDADARSARDGAAEFLKAGRFGYVVIDRGRASSELRKFAVDTFGLVKIAEAGSQELYVPQNGPL